MHRFAQLAVLVGTAACAPSAAFDGNLDSPQSPESSCAAEGTHPHDFVIVGSGAGGGPLAARLARAGCRVLLIEAGADVGGRAEYQVPAMHALSTEDSAMAWSFYVGHHADEAVDREDSKYVESERGILYPRGSALGGSTAVNALVTILPSRSDWNRLAALTNDGTWRAESMAPYYDRVLEWLDVEIPNPTLAAGDEKVTRFLMSAARAHAEETGASTVDDLLEDVDEAAALTTLLAQDVNEGLLDAETTGLFRIPLATRAGKRNGTRERILDTVAEGHPLDIMTNTFGLRVVFEGSRAVGVEIAKGARLYGATIGDRGVETERATVYANHEVILAAGAFNSPQLLMLSGIGDPAHLVEHGIGVVAARPGVGNNLQDRNEVAVVSEFDEAIDLVEPCTLGSDDPADPCLDDWNDQRGVYETTGFLATVLKRSRPDLALADLQVFAAAGDARGYYPGYSKDALRVPTRFSWLILKGHTENRDGTVRLRSPNPFDRPDIDFNYFDEADPMNDPDLAAVVSGVRFVREIIAQANEDDDDLTEIWPGPDVSTDLAIAQWARREAWGHHASCSNKMGLPDDPTAVVDPRFRVIGVEGLRVVDASVFPEIPGTFIALPTFMLSEKAADTILEDYR